MKYIIASALMLVLFQNSSDGIFILIGYDGNVPIFENVISSGSMYSLSDDFHKKRYKDIGKEKDILFVTSDLLITGQQIEGSYKIQFENGFNIIIDSKPVKIELSKESDIFYFLSQDYVIHRVDMRTKTVESLDIKSDYMAVRNQSLYYTEESNFGAGFVNLVKASIYEHSKKKIILENLYSEGIEISSSEEFIACLMPNNGEAAYTVVNCKGRLINQINIQLVEENNLYPFFKKDYLFYYKPEGLKVFDSRNIFNKK